MRKIINILCVGACVLSGVLFAACDPETDYKTRRVEITIDTIPGRISAGFCEVHCKPSREAYYYLSATPALEEMGGLNINPLDYEEQFMTLALDTAYINYLQWRFDLLKQGREHIADFASHSLQYGEVTYRFTHLIPGMDYWIFAFVVDPETKTPVGNLFLQTIHTPTESIFRGENAVHFAYRVKGSWDYIYPYMSYGDYDDIVDYVPWVGETADSVVVREGLAQMGIPAALADSLGPGVYFSQHYKASDNVAAHRVLYGIYAHNNNGVGDGTTSTNFEVGHTYYTAISVVDGDERSKESYDIYKFTYVGDSTLVEYMHEMNTGGYWSLEDYERGKRITE